MSAKYLFLIRGKSYHLTSNEIPDKLKESSRFGLILVYSQMLENSKLRDMLPEEFESLPLQEGVLELRTPNDHPEQKEGRVFLFNADSTDARRLLAWVGWTREVGEVAYSPKTGKPLPSSVRPYFGRIEDVFNLKH